MDINQALPEDILYEILTRVPILDSGRCRMVCKMWDSMMNEVTFKMTRRAKKDYVWFRDLHKNGFLLVKLKQALYNRKITRLEGMFSVKLERKPSKKFGDAQFSNQADCVIALKSADELFVLNLLSGYCRSVGKFPGLMGFGIGFKIHEGVLSVRVFVHNLDLTGVCIDVGVVTASQTITGDIPAFPCEWGDGMFLGGIVYSICQWSSQIVAFDFETSKFLTLGFPLDVKPNLVSRSNARVGHFDGCLSFSHSLGELCKIWLRKKDVWHSFSTIGGRRGVCVPISRLTGDLLLVDSDYGVQVMDTNNRVLSLMQNKVKFCGKNTHLFVHPFSARHFKAMKKEVEIGGCKRAYICSSSLRKASLQALAKTLTVPQLTYLKEQFQMLSPSKNGYVSLQNFKTTIVRNATDAIKDSRVIDNVNMVSSLQYRKMDFEEFCAAAISVHQLEAMDTWEQHARHAYELFEKDGNRPIMIEELASELGLSPSVPVHVVLQDWIRHSDGKLSFLGFVRLLHGVSSHTFQKA